MKEIDTQFISNHITNFGDTISKISTEYINKILESFQVITDKYIKEIDFKNLGEGISVILVKSTEIFKEMKPELENIFLELIDVYGSMIEKSNPIFKKVLDNLVDSAISVFTIFLSKASILISKTIQDIIKSIPGFGQGFSIIVLSASAAEMVVELLSKLISIANKLTSIVNEIVETVNDNIENFRKIDSELLSILIKIFKKIISVIPFLNNDKETPPEETTLEETPAEETSQKVYKMPKSIYSMKKVGGKRKNTST
jgi:hypothetical protein